MNFKLTAVASAVAMSIALPLTAQAEGGGFYGSVRVGAEYSDGGKFIDEFGQTVDPDANIDIRSWASRFGFKGETEMANGLTGFGKYEFGVNTSGSPSVRHANVGLKGDFGTLTIGQAYHTWYNNVIGKIDLPWWGSCNGCIAYTGRSTAATYEGNFGAGTGGVTLYMVGNDPDSNELDGFEIGATFPVGSMSLGLGIQDLDNGTEATLGAALSGTSGNIGWAAAVTSQAAPSGSGADDALGIEVYAGIGNGYIDVGTVSANNDSLGITLGYTKTIGENTLSWFELQSSDSGADGSSADLTLRAALKHDWN